MKYSNITLSLALLLCTFSRVRSQDLNKMGDLLPPAPNASAIVKYGEITLSKNTGVPNISIPLYALKSKKAGAMVSLGYSSSGIRVDEIASRVGMGWALNAGGVITRTVRGTADDLNTRHLPYATIGTNWSTFSYMRRIGRSLTAHGNQGGYDAEPDLFNYSFEGRSGKFILDSTLSVMQIPVSNNKIYYNFSGTDWNFKIVTSDGISYYFGGTDAVEKTKREQICSKLFDTYITTAWYLKKIEHPNGDNVRFVYTSHEYKYDNGTSQSMYWVNPFPNPGHSCNAGGAPTLSTTTCINKTVTEGVLLSEIIIDNNSKVQFTYITRDDCEDKLVSKVELVDLMASSTIGSYDLIYSTVTANSSFANGYHVGYNKTPYLVSLVENSAGNTLHKTHCFKYNDPAGRPPRLSYSQDHWGYFNGQVNTSLVARPELYLQERFPDATANREPAETYAAKGMLSKIIYPTGGMDTLLYEGNNVADSVAPRPQHRYTCEVTGTGNSTQVTKTRSFDLDLGQYVELNINCIDNTGNGGFDPLHNKGKVEIINASNSVVFTEIFTPGTMLTRYVSLAAGTYNIKLYANGTAVTTRATLKHYPVSGSLVSKNKANGGLRVKYIIRGNAGETPSITRYHYAHLSNLSLSSQNFYVNPEYLREFNHTGFCTSNASNGGYSYQAFALQSNSVISMNDYNYSTVSYRGVVESQGENFENGGVYSKFAAISDSWGVMLMGVQINNAPKSNFSSVLNGQLLEETTFKKAGSTIVPLVKVTNTYKIDDRNGKIDYAYYVHDRNNGYLPSDPDTLCDPTVPPTNVTSCYPMLMTWIGAFDMLRYEIMTQWVYVDTSTTITYNQNGQNPLTTMKLFFYDSASHMQLTRTEETDSKGNVRKELFKYTHNFQGTQVYADMVSKNIIDEVIEYKTYENTNELTQSKTNYAEWASGNFEPSTTEGATRGNTLETNGTVNLYDKSGNVLQYTGRDGTVTSYLWGYRYLYPVAKITGATYAEVIATLSVDTAQLQSLDGAALRTELHRIRTGFPTAMVTTLTHKHLAGATSVTDVNNRTLTYYYDAFNRLRVIRDQDSNIVKRIDYSYATPDSSAVFAPYLNADTTGYSTITGCQNGYVASQVSFNVPAGMFFSFVSQADANAKAAAYFTSNQQAITNAGGYCDNTLTCTGVDRKVIDCMCIIGWKTYTDTYQNANGTWTCLYKYYFPNNTWSTQYSEINSSPCGDVE
jgi:YD repeat-containing protein